MNLLPRPLQSCWLVPVFGIFHGSASAHQRFDKLQSRFLI